MTSSRLFTRLINAGFLFRTVFPAHTSERPVAYQVRPALFSLLIFSVTLQLFLCQNLHAQTVTAISGVVTDSSGLPLSGAHVTIDEIQIGTVTDRFGRYSLDNLIPGEYTLTASYLGFCGTSFEEVEVLTGAVTRVDFSLISLPITMPVVRVQSSYEPGIVSSDNSIVISRSWWETRGAASVGDALRDVPGVTILEGGGMQRVSLRGSPGRAVKVEMDEIPLNDAGTGEADISGINLDRIKSIEVVYKGLGGTVNLSTEDVMFSNSGNIGTEADLGFDSFGASRAGLGLNADRSDIQSVLLIDHYDDPGDFKYSLDNGEIHSRVNNQVQSTGAILKVKRQQDVFNLDSGVYYQSNNRGIPGLIYQPATPEASLGTRRVSARISTQLYKNPYMIGLAGYISDYQSSYLNPAVQFDPSTGEFVYHLPEDNIQNGFRSGIGADYKRFLGHHSFSASYSFQYDRYRGEDRLRKVETIGSPGLGGARRWSHELITSSWLTKEINDYAINLSPALNSKIVKDEGSRTYTQVSPEIYTSIARTLKPFRVIADAGWGRTLSTPPFNALFLVENTFAVGNPNLKPEKGESLNFGLSAISSLDSPFDWNLKLSRFFRDTDDLIVWRRNFQGKYYPANVDHVKTRGMEINGSISTKNGFLRLFGSYIYNRSVNDTEGDLNQGRLIPLIPKDSGSAGITLRKWKTSLNFSGRWTGRRYSTEANQDYQSSSGRGLPPYAVYDLTVIKRLDFKRWNVSGEIGLKNIFDRSYMIIERSPMPGRSLNMKLTLGI